jgi:hypothetical protein
MKQQQMLVKMKLLLDGTTMNVGWNGTTVGQNSNRHRMEVGGKSDES